MDVFRFEVTFQRVSDSAQNNLETCCVVVRTCAAALVFLVGTRSRRSRSAVVLRRQGAIRSEEGAHAKSLEFAASRGLAPVSGNGPAAVQSAHDAGHAREQLGSGLHIYIWVGSIVGCSPLESICHHHQLFIHNENS